MKTRLIASLLLSFASLACAQSDIIPLFKKRSDDTINVGFNTGAKTVKISATGTLEWVNGATFTGASYFRTAAGVQASSAILSAFSGLSNSAGVLANNGSGTLSYVATSTGGNGTDDSGKIAKFNATGQIAGGFVGTFDGGPSYNFVSISEGLSIGSETNSGTFGVPAAGGTSLVWTLPSVTGTLVSTGDTGSVTNTMLAGSIALTKLLQSSATSGQVIAWNGSAWAPVTISTGLTIGTSAISGGTDGYILYNNAGVLGHLATTGSGSVVRATSPTMSDVTITGKTYLAGTNNYVWRNGSGDTEIVSATNTVTMVTFTGAPIMTATISGLTLPGLVVDSGGAYSYPGAYPSLPNYENFARGRSYRPGTNVTAFAHQIIAPGDIYDGAGITITDAATLYIHGEPFAHPAGAAIAGNKWALWIGHGASRFDGPVALGAGGTTHTKIKSGVATLVAGTVTVSDSDVLETGTAATSSRILVTRMTDSGTLGTGYSITRVNATSFRITSSSSAETSTLSWVIFNP